MTSEPVPTHDLAAERGLLIAVLVMVLAGTAGLLLIVG
jgi:hypothetical protein